MLNPDALLKTNGEWQFANEKELEDFFKHNSLQLVGLPILKQQYRVNNEICDLVGTTLNRQLVIIELKNTEDRYVVQQLTRYYDSLMDKKPEELDIDWNIPSRLIAVLPQIHRDNLTDRKYSILHIELFKFEIEQQKKKIFLKLTDIDSSNFTIVEIPYPKHLITDEKSIDYSKPTIPKIPRGLRIFLEEFPEYEKVISQIREKIFLFDERISENSNIATKYGLAKIGKSIPDSKLCVEIYPLRYNSVFFFLRLSLWLPYCKDKRVLAPFNKNTVKFGIDLKPKDIYQEVSTLELFRSNKTSANPKHRININSYWQVYKKITGFLQKSNTVESLIEISLEHWLERINTLV